MSGNYRDGAWRNAMRVRVDYNNMTTRFVGARGIAPEELKAAAARWQGAFDALEAGRGRMKWRELPFNQAEVVRRLEASGVG